MGWNTAAIVASGPSLNKQQIRKALKKGKNWRWIAVNDSYKLAPFADILYACDKEWWDKYASSIEFEGERWTQDNDAAAQYGLNHVSGVSLPGLGTDCVHFGDNGGYQAINLAYLLGARRIILLGFDCQPVGGLDHWFGQHPEGLVQRQPYESWQQKFPALARDLQAEGVEVINCSPTTALDCFPIQMIEDVKP